MVADRRREASQDVAACTLERALDVARSITVPAAMGAAGRRFSSNNRLSVVSKKTLQAHVSGDPVRV